MSDRVGHSVAVVVGSGLFREWWLGVSEDQLEQPEVRAAARRLLTQGHWQAIEVGRAEPPRGSALDVPKPEPTGPVLPRKKKEVVEALSWVSIELLDHSGVPFADFELTLEHSDGRRDRVVLDAAGRHTALDVKPPGPTRVILPARVELPASARDGLAMDGFAKSPADIGVAREPTDHLALNTLDRHYRFIVDAPALLTEVQIDGWAQSSKVMRWGGMRPRADATVATIRAALRLALQHGRGRTMCVVGHTDPLGQDDDNQSLSVQRAKSVQLFAAGDLDQWAEDAFANATELDLRCALVACHAIVGLGPTTLDNQDALDAARARVRLDAGLPVAGAVEVGDWRAIAEVYDADLAALLATDRGGLAELRATVRWTEPPTVGLGERYPRPPAELADMIGMPALPHRRAGLLVFDVAADAQIAVDRGGDQFYDGTYTRIVVPVPEEVYVQVIVDTTTQQSIARGRAWINIADLGATEHIADADGTIRFMTLAGDKITVIAAFDSDGLGTMSSAQTEQA